MDRSGMSTARGPADYLSCTIRSLSPAPLRVVASEVAKRWGSDPVLAPDRAGFSERTKLLRGRSLVDLLEDAWARGREIDDVWLYAERPELDLIGDLRYFDQLPDGEDHTMNFSIAAHAGAPPDAMVDLACDLFVAIDGFYGFVDTVSFADHQFALASEGSRRGVVPTLAPDDTTTYRFDYHVDGPWWANLYGPAFVERWGDTVDDLGVARRRLDNSGVLVMTAEVPVEVDPAVSTLLGYPHQRSLVDQVGDSVFRHETGSNDLGPAGASVPTRSEHVVAARRYPRR